MKLEVRPVGYVAGPGSQTQSPTLNEKLTVCLWPTQSSDMNPTEMLQHDHIKAIQPLKPSSEADFYHSTKIITGVFKMRPGAH